MYLFHPNGLWREVSGMEMARYGVMEQERVRVQQESRVWERSV